MIDTPNSRYLKDLEKHDFEEDAAQRLAVDKLQGLFDQLISAKAQKQSFLSKMGICKRRHQQPVQGLYFWGGVGRGKTYLVDTFFECLPFEHKLRMHFHRFMHRIHLERKSLKEHADPIAIIANKLADEARVLCFDEFVVHDVADAVILARLMKVLFDRGVTLVATSNVEPNQLYMGGLQRDLFIPAIKMIHQFTDVVELDSGIDYRLRFLDKAETYFYPLNEVAKEGMHYNFDHLATEQTAINSNIEINGRNLKPLQRADGVIWFDFAELCDGPRSQADYLELARCFHSVLLSGIPVMNRLMEDQARRFINLVDVLYDHNVKLIISAQDEVAKLYKGSRVKFEFRRTISRLQEMQSHDYLALQHDTT